MESIPEVLMFVEDGLEVVRGRPFTPLALPFSLLVVDPLELLLLIWLNLLGAKMEASEPANLECVTGLRRQCTDGCEDNNDARSERVVKVIIKGGG